MSYKTNICLPFARTWVHPNPPIPPVPGFWWMPCSQLYSFLCCFVLCLSSSYVNGDSASELSTRDCPSVFSNVFVSLLILMKVLVPKQESDRLGICVFMVLIVSPFVWFWHCPDVLHFISCNYVGETAKYYLETPIMQWHQNTIVGNCAKQGDRGELFLSMCYKIEFIVPSWLTEFRFCKTGLYGIQTFVINGGFLWKKNMD